MIFSLPRGIAVATLLTALVAGLPSCKKRGSVAKISNGNMVASEEAPSDLTHEYFRFRISGLGNKWKIFDHETATTLLPDAAAMAMKVDGTYCAVIVEPLGGVDSSAYHELILENMSGMVLGFESEEPVEVEVAGKQARRSHFNGVVNGLTTRYEAITFVHSGFGYQLLCWWQGEKGSSRKSTDEFFRAFSLDEGEVTTPPDPPLPDYHGVGRRVKDGRFESPAYRLAATAPEGWRFMSEAEMIQNTEGAELALQCGARGLYVAVAPEHYPPDEVAQAVENAFPEISTENDLDPVVLEFAGEAMTFRQTVMDVGVPLHLYLGARAEGSILYRISAWHLDQAGTSLADEVQVGLSSISLLTEAQSAGIRDEMSGLPHPQSTVGPTFALRHGTFREFDDGVTWKAPAGFWRFATGDEAVMANEAITFQAEESATGLYLQLVSEDADEWALENFHETVMALFKDKPADVEAAEIELDGQPALSSVCRQAVNGSFLTRRVVTTLRGNRAHQIHFWIWEGNAATATPLIDSALAGFEFPGESLLSTEHSAHTYTDHRLGFHLRLPAREWKLKEHLNPSIAALGNSTMHLHADAMVMSVGMNIGLSGDGDAAIRQLVEGIIATNYSRASNQPPKETKQAIHGVETTVKAWDFSDASLRAATFRHHGAIFLLLIAEKDAKAADKLAKSVFHGFEFMP